MELFQFRSLKEQTTLCKYTPGFLFLFPSPNPESFNSYHHEKYIKMERLQAHSKLADDFNHKNTSNFF